VATEGLYCASDALALLPLANKTVTVDNGEPVTLTPEDFEIKKIRDSSVVVPKPRTLDWSPEMAVKGGYPHFMLKEIHDESHSTVIRNTAEMKARRGSTIAAVEEGDEEIKKLTDDYVEVPKGIGDLLSPTLFVVPLQLAYYMAVEEGHDRDMPRNLAKSVIVR
jgi:glucosamine 6-phosphate synthetase-like amidotransferase/phosphosugar isomerase protein